MQRIMLMTINKHTYKDLQYIHCAAKNAPYTVCNISVKPLYTEIIISIYIYSQ